MYARRNGGEGWGAKQECWVIKRKASDKRDSSRDMQKVRREAEVCQRAGHNVLHRGGHSPPEVYSQVCFLNGQMEAVPNLSPLPAKHYNSLWNSSFKKIEIDCFLSYIQHSYTFQQQFSYGNHLPPHAPLEAPWPTVYSWIPPKQTPKFYCTQVYPSSFHHKASSAC